jgi:hypothetical protein
MQEKTALSSRDRAAYINSLQKNPNFTKEIIQLVKSDLEAGISKEETEEYSSCDRYSYQQMCVFQMPAQRLQLGSKGIDFKGYFQCRTDGSSCGIL